MCLTGDVQQAKLVVFCVSAVFLTELQAVPLGLSHLHLSACERLTGEGLCKLSRLRNLRLSGCPAVTETAVQVGISNPKSCQDLTFTQMNIAQLAAQPAV